MFLLGQPQNLPTSIRLVAELIDEIWYQSGDTSTDFNWYTKRTLLAGVYISTELHMLNDKSDNYNDTWQFLDRRIENIMNFGKIKADISGITELVSNTLLNTISRFRSRS